MATALMTDAPPIDPVLLVDALNSEAEYQAARSILQQAKAKRERHLYELWRGAKGNARAVAAQMPKTIKTETVKAAALKLAPPEDFIQLDLLDLLREVQEAKDAHALAA
ncbi:hypothetical protein [Kitasatospora sp. NPDC088134]|uniref:hypothetical protein n=1 Tax=Kitasatospora sp. NPDC088134 TaxID=3364071 RepID=UPI00381ECA9C